jgi:hypothetical protein
MKLKRFIVAASALLLIVGTAQAKSARSPAVTSPSDRYFDAAHGPNDPQSLWVAGDYVGRDTDPTIRSSMTRELLQGFPQ